LDQERQAALARVAEVEQLLETERRRFKEEKDELVRSQVPSQQAKQLEEQRVLTRQLKTFLEQAVAREAAEKKKATEVETELRALKDVRDAVSLFSSLF